MFVLRSFQRGNCGTTLCAFDEHFSGDAANHLLLVLILLKCVPEANSIGRDVLEALLLAHIRASYARHGGCRKL